MSQHRHQHDSHCSCGHDHDSLKGTPLILRILALGSLLAIVAALIYVVVTHQN